jgi:putative SOS response-associated peptidase YedK
MCGRYASSRNPDDLVLEFEVDENDLEEPVAPRYNIAPTETVPVVLERLVTPPLAGEAVGDASTDASADDSDDASLDVSDDASAGSGVAGGTGGTAPGSALIEDADPGDPVVVRRLRPLTWGLVPSWSKERTGGARMINARAESLLEKPAYRKAALARRCLVPADGWYEWQVSPTETDQKGKPRKQPFFMRPADGGGLAFAGIYEFWRDAARHADDPQAWLVTFAIITTAAEPDLERIHDRMPLVLPRDRWADWLDPTLSDADDVRALIAAPEPGRFAALPVSTRVNSVRNDGPDLLEPAPADQLAGVVDPATGELLGGPAEELAEPLF